MNNVIKEYSDLDYWKEEFRKAIENEKFVWDYCEDKTYRREEFSIVIDKEYGRKLGDICKNNKFLIYTFLVSILNITLSKCTMKKNITVGIPCYSSEDKKKAMINKLLPLTSDIDYEDTYLQYVMATKEQILEVYKRQHCLYLKMLLENQVLNDVMELTTANICMKGLHQDKYINYICNSSKNEVSFVIKLLEDHSIKIDSIYNASKISQDNIENLNRSFITVFKNILKNTKQRIRDIKILSEEEVNQILYSFNDTKAEYPKDKVIQELFEAQVEMAPDNIAVEFEDNKLTYRELNEKSNSLARILRDKKVKADTIVAIMVERSLEMIIGIMGILKAGGAYLPIDPKYPKERIEYMLKDSGSKILLSSETLAHHVEFDGEIVDLFNEDLFSRCSSNLEKINTSSNLAYIIYTSGTTGNPKGVMIEHKALINRLNWMQKKYPLSEADAILQKTTYTFDVSVWEILWWSLVGAKVCMLSPNDEKDPIKIIEAIDKYKITTIHFVPSMLDILLYCLEESNKAFKLDSLRQVFCSGEALNFKQVSKFYKEFGLRKKLINLYGPTEAAIDVSYFECNEDSTKVIPIGKPIDNIKLYILNNGELAPIGLQGELYISGAGLARGYLNKSELTDEKFVDNPFEPDAKMYKTGDLARWLPDGNIEFLGRIDNQVKIRGLRIELGEIENRLLDHEDIEEVGVIAKEIKGSEKYICAYVVSKKQISDLNLKSYLKEVLPEYMVPAYFIQLEKMPLTSNGKLNKKQLPEPDLYGDQNEYEAPTTKIEKILAKIWGEVLEVENIGINDNFFDLGGHSLKATILASKMHKELNREIPLKEIFKAPTIKELSKFIETSQENFCLNIEKLQEKDYYEASSAQKRMYMLQQFDKDSIAYNMPTIFRIDGEIDKQRIEETFKILIRRHDALRTYFETLEGQIVQKVSNVYDFKLVERKDDKDIKNSIEEFVKSFKLDKAPLFRVELVQSGKEKYLLMDIHHIISDGVSTNILIKEFTEIYNGKDLEPLKLQYKDFAAWQNNLLKSDEMKKQEEYWINVFNDEVPVLNLPYDYERPAMRNSEGESVSFKVDSKTTEALVRLSKVTGTTMHMVLLSAFNILISKYSGQEDIVIGIPIAGRHNADLQNIMGMFVNTLALRNKLEGDKKYIDFLSEVKENSLMAYENQSYQFEKLVEKLDIKRDRSRNPIFDVMFNMGDKIISNDIKLDGFLLRNYKNPNEVSKFDLTLNAAEKDAAIELSINYCSKLFKKDTIERLKNHYIKILEVITNNAEIKICEIDLLSDEEKNQIVHEFNDTKFNYPDHKTIQELFEEQVEKTPDNIAVVFEDKKLTYRELNEKANSLARILIDKGVKAESIVGIMVERSLEMIIGIMGILKSGGAYLPIDPNYPKERIEYMLHDSGCKVMLSRNVLMQAINFDCDVIDLFNEELFINDLSNPEKINKSNSLAYVIYTSGTTGKPKGVMIEHRQVNNFIKSIVKETKLNLYKSILCITTISFDIFGMETLVPLTQGLMVGLANSEQQMDGDKLGNFIEKNSIEIMQSTPSRFKMLLENNVFKKSIGSIKLLLTGGEEANDRLVTTLHESSDAKIYNLYGPTETTIWSMAKELNKNEKITIGKPISNTQVYILNNNAIMPIGVAGELCISGDGVARGYLNKPELTARKFIDNPFEEGGKIYKTGDLARWLPNGNIEFLGRIDNQVKIRGFRIELGEIENRLLQHEDIKEVAVVVKETKQKEKIICAYIVSEKEIGELNLKSYLKKSLPEYMIPSHLMQLDQMPITSNGKVDKKTLMNLDTITTSSVEYHEPENPIQEVLVEIWKDILGVEKIGIYEDFFELGGTSVNVFKLAAEINERFSIELSFAEVVDNLKIKDLAELVVNKLNRRSASSVVLYNDKQDKNIFCLPPITGYGVIYRNMRSYIDNYSIYGFNYLEFDDILQRYANEIIELQPTGPLVLAGYSSGGRLAFNVVAILEKMGRTVSKLIMIDCVERLLQRVELSDEVLNREVARNLELLESDKRYVLFKDEIIEKRKKYAKFCFDLVDEDIINADIHFISSEDTTNSPETWRGATKGKLYIYEGIGNHFVMMNGEYIKTNATIINNILNNDKVEIKEGGC